MKMTVATLEMEAVLWNTFLHLKCIISLSSLYKFGCPKNKKPQYAKSVSECGLVYDFSTKKSERYTARLPKWKLKKLINLCIQGKIVYLVQIEQFRPFLSEFLAKTSFGSIRFGHLGMNTSTDEWIIELFKFITDWEWR